MDNLLRNAERLPSAVRILATTSYVQFLDRYPIIKKVKPEHWDFIITVAGIFVAVSQLNHEDIPEHEKDAMLDTITRVGIKIYPDSVEACEDCRNFVDQTYSQLANEKRYKADSKFLFSDSLGTWIVWNIFGHKPLNEDEVNLIRILGSFLVHSFITWWKEDKK